MTLHNPAQLSAETIGEGYRLLTTGELTKLPDDAEFMGGGEWLASAFRGQDSSAWSKEYTYRTRTAHPTPEQMFPIQGRENYTGENVSIPWEMAEMAYAEYSERYGTTQSLERLAERQGFGVYEIIELLCARIKRLSAQSNEGTK
jgi:hypothetical protein